MGLGRAASGRVGLWRIVAVAAALGVALAAAGPARAADTSWSMYSNYYTSYSIPFSTTPNFANGTTEMEVSAYVKIGSIQGTAIPFQIDTGSTGVALPAYDIPGYSGGSSQTFGYSSSGNVGHGQWVDASVVFNQGTAVNGQLPTSSVPVFVVASVTDSHGTVFDCRTKTTEAELNCFRMMGVAYGRPGGSDVPPITLTNNALLHLQGMDATGGAPPTVRAGYVITPTGIQAGLTSDNASSNYALIQLTPKVIGDKPNWETMPGQIYINGTQDTRNSTVLMDTGISYVWTSVGDAEHVVCHPRPADNYYCPPSGTDIRIALGAPGNPNQIGYAYVVDGTSNTELAPSFTRVNFENGEVNTGIHPYAGFYYFFDAVGGFVGLRRIEGMDTDTSFTPSLAITGTLALPDSFASNLPVYVSAASTLSAASTATFSGDVGGPGQLTISGLGSITLSGNVTLPAGIVVSSGGLALSALATADISVGSGGWLTAGGTLTGTVTNAGTFANLGTLVGLLTNSGSAENFGTIQGNVANTGTFYNDGVVTGSVSNHGVLGGNGTIRGDLEVDGRLSPGHSVGQINVQGDVLLTSSAVYVAELGGGGTADLFHADGEIVSNGSTIQLVPLADYNPVLGGTYVVITAGAGVTGSFLVSAPAFGSVSALYPFLAPGLSIGSGGVSIEMERSAVPFAALATTSNQAGAASAVGSLSSTSPVAAALASVSAFAAPAAFASLDGEIYASAQSVLQTQSAYLRNAVTGRLLQATAGVPAGAGPRAVEMPGIAGATLWGQAYAGWGSNDGNANASGYSSSVGGFIMGLDTALAGWRVGLAAGFGQSQFDLDSGLSSGSSDTYDLSLYAGRSFGALSLRFGAAYSWHDLSSQRTVALPSFVQSYGTGYDGRTAQLFGEVGYAFQVPGVAGAGIEPFAGLSYVALSTDGFTEAGGGAALTGASSNFDTLSTTLGVRGQVPLALMGGIPVMLNGTLGWQHAYGNLTPTTTLAFTSGSTPFTAYGAPLASDAVIAALGLSAQVSANLSLSIAYGGQLSSDVMENAVKGSFVWSF